jgi:outer membrane protein
MIILNKLKINQLAFVMLIGMLLAAFYTNAQTTITMAQAIQNGLANKKNSIAGKIDSSISKLQTQALYRKYWPQVSAEYSYMYNPILQTSILPIGIFNPTYPADATKSVQFGTKWSQSAGLTATQSLLDLAIARHIKEAKLQQQITSLSTANSNYELAYVITQTYIDIYLQDAKIVSGIADTIRTYNSYILLKNKFDENRLLKSDVNKAIVNHNNAKQSLADAVMKLIENKVYLLYLMGNHKFENWDYEIDTTLPTKFAFVNDSLISTLNQLPELQILSLQSDLALMQTKSERVKNIPTINAKGFLGANQFTNTFNPVAANSWFGLSYVGLQIKFPILFGENTNNRMQQLQLQANQFNLQKEDKTLQYAKDVLLSKLKTDNLNNQIKIQAENIALSIESIIIFQARVKEGQESVLNLNIEEANLQILQANYEATKKQLWVYWLDRLKASGQLTVLWK